jgi:hypothetical protein
MVRLWFAGLLVEIGLIRRAGCDTRLPTQKILAGIRRGVAAFSIARAGYNCSSTSIAVTESAGNGGKKNCHVWRSGSISRDQIISNRCQRPTSLRSIERISGELLRTGRRLARLERPGRGVCRARIRLTASARRLKIAPPARAGGGNNGVPGVGFEGAQRARYALPRFISQVDSAINIAVVCQHYLPRILFHQAAGVVRLLRHFMCIILERMT